MRQQATIEVRELTYILVNECSSFIEMPSQLYEGLFLIHLG